jgi:hypothetical protein
MDFKGIELYMRFKRNKLLKNNYLNQPYPLSGNQWKTAIMVSLYISLFMYFFQPFGLAAFKSEYRSYYEIGYGLVTFMVLSFDLYLMPLVFKSIFKSSSWTVLKQIIWQMWILFTIGIFNFLYSAAFLGFTNYFKAFFIFQFFTLLVGVFPVVLVTIINQNRLLAKNLKIANNCNNDLPQREKPQLNNEKICISSESNKDNFEVHTSDLLYITSFGNYIQAYYLNNGEPKKIVLRNTLKQTEDQLKDVHCMIKCHRAFLVNKNKIIRVKGNSQGLRLEIDGTDDEVPVSRALSKSLMQVING